VEIAVSLAYVAVGTHVGAAEIGNWSLILDKADASSGKRSKSLTETAYAVLRERIITGELAPGTDVSEPELAEQLSVSKTPVREALARLCVEGFMEAYPRRGYRVTPVTIKGMNALRCGTRFA
jgi:DNA-binding GntR family transcriptional regulator